MPSKYGQTEMLLEEWNQGEDNFLSIARNNDSSAYASIKSFISVNWLYLISSWFTKQTSICVQRGEEKEDEFKS